ncbi:hypothetical protein ACFFQF_00600 [Haladaptatus pallidirubidus]|uniref:Uncharacterized protein n=1 Tax=Haladaptatus pallidirubidus TaxID=1008152 RepID=A0AAV3UBT6_9EURY|nr:hypothetical protein [Haladaptatus pallidirubidus]
MSDGNDGEISTANTMRERAGESRIKLWLVLGARRLVVTGAIAVVFFVSFVVAGTVLYPPLKSEIARTDTIETMFSTMIGANITGTTLVVTISQLVISQENGPLGDQRQRMSDAMDFRNFVGELLGHTTPSDPSAFLKEIISATESRAYELRDSIGEDGNEELREELDEFVDSLTGNADTVKDQLDGAVFGTFDVLFAALNFNYSWKIFHVERMRDEYSDSLDDEQHRLFEELKTSLSMFGPAREHIKTLYFQWALIDLSQLILYAAIPALFVAGAMLAFVGSGTFTGTTLGVTDILWVVSGAFTVTLVPFMLLVSYILRIATVAKRTLAIGPLILRDSQR